MRVQSLQETIHSMLKSLKQRKVLYWILCIQWTTQTVIYMLSGALLCFCKWAGWEFSTILWFNNHPASLREHHSQLNIQKSYALTLRRNVFHRKDQFEKYLISQSHFEPYVTLLTTTLFPQYTIQIRWKVVDWGPNMQHVKYLRRVVNKF